MHVIQKIISYLLYQNHKTTDNYKQEEKNLSQRKLSQENWAWEDKLTLLNSWHAQEDRLSQFNWLIECADCKSLNEK